MLKFCPHLCRIPEFLLFGFDPPAPFLVPLFHPPPCGCWKCSPGRGNQARIEILKMEFMNFPAASLSRVCLGVAAQNSGFLLQQHF